MYRKTCELGTGFVANYVKTYRESNNDTDHNLLPERWHIQNIEAITNNRQQNCAHQGAGGFAGTTSK